MKKNKPIFKQEDSSFYRIDASESEFLYLDISQIKNAGKGLFTAINIYKDEIICEFKGEIISKSEAKRREKKGNYKYFVQLLDGSIMDSMKTKCFAKYANDPLGFEKSKFKINSYITLDDDDAVCLVASRDILVGEEIFCSYGSRYWDTFQKERLLKVDGGAVRPQSQCAD